MITFKPKSKTGFTLIEAILYLAIAGTVLYFISGFAFNAIFGKSKIETIQEINQSSRSVLDEMSRAVGDSVEINGALGGGDEESGGETTGCVATGGTISTVEGDTIHTFTESGDFIVTGSCNVEVLVVAGGGGGNGGETGINYGSAGAGGTVIYDDSYVAVGTVSVVVGEGGEGVITGTGGSGGDSEFGTIIATGGTGTLNTLLEGGSNANYSGGTQPGVGADGWAGGGGAGGGGDGSERNGGIGYSSSISGVSTGYAGGGASWSFWDGTGTAVSGGGHATYGDGENGDPNTGGGGAGGNVDAAARGGDGGSGIVIVRYLAI